MNLDYITATQSSKEVTANALFDAAAPSTAFGRRAAGCVALTWAYYGADISAAGSTVVTSVANGSVTLAASATNYVELTLGTYVVSVNQAGFTTGKIPLFKVVTGASSVTSWTDVRPTYASTYGSGFTNPMNAAGDIIYGGIGGAATRLAKGADGQVLTLVAGVPAWAASSGGFANPMTASGDIIYGSASGAATRLAKGADGQVLTLAGGVPTWAAATGGGGTAFTGGTLTYAINEAPTVTIASAATVAIGAAAANTISVTGTTTVAAFDAIAAGARRLVVFAGALTLTHNSASLILPTGANIPTAAGDTAEFVSLGSGNWRCVAYTRANGQALASSGGGGGLTNFTDTLNTTTPNSPTPVAAIKAANAATDVDIAIVPKGNGGIAGNVADGAVAGGNKRGSLAIDMQLTRTTAAQVASGAFAVIGGGTDNTASGQYATVLGGAGSSASGVNATVGGGSGNASSNSYATVSGGRSNTASGLYSAVCGGYTNTAATNYSFIGGGQSNNTTGSTQHATILAGFSNAINGGSYVTVTGGQFNTASGDYSRVHGAYGTDRGIIGVDVFSPGKRLAVGDRQVLRAVLNATTTNAAATVLTTDAGAVTAKNQVLIPYYGVIKVRGQVVAYKSTGEVAGFDVTALVKSNAAASVVGTPTVTQIAADAGCTGYTVAIGVDTTNYALKVTVTGGAADTVYWSASVEAIYAA